MKEIKLFIINYKFTVDTFGADKQKELHRKWFTEVLQNYMSGVIETSVSVDEGELLFIEAVDYEGKMCLKYFFRYKY